ncbi:MAG TPA: MscL family protein [Pyrinomonadaceae bacterium]
MSLTVSKGVPASLAGAKANGIPVIAYGQFFNDIINFLIIGLVIFFMVKGVNRIRRQPDEAPAPTNEEKILIDIRDILQARR